MITGLGPAQALLILQGLKWTLLLSVIAFLGGGLGGFGIALCRTSTRRWLRIAATVFIETFRGTPLLLQLFMVYYGLALLNFPLDPWIAVAIGFTLNASAFLGEIWRGSIDAVPKGQAEAAKALGLHYGPRMRLVVLPQALRTAVPPTVGFLVQLIKGTSLAAIIGFTELARTGQQLSNITYQPRLVYSVIGAVYFVICWPVSWFGRR
ncbi:MAG: amino acid ABC transporter permease, partial [Oxalobacteraceae bacterium]